MCSVGWAASSVTVVSVLSSKGVYILGEWSGM